METQLEVVHETRYEYTSRVDVAHQLMHLSPRTTSRQRVLRHRIEIVPAPSERRDAEDYFGNPATLCALFEPHDALCVRASSRVAIAPRYVPLAACPDMPWETVREALRFAAGRPYLRAAEFVPASPFVPMLAELRAYARASFAPRRPWREAAVDLMHRVHADFAYDPQATEVATPLLQAFEQRSGVCQDFAHLMVGALRTLGLPAAYVSGYLLTEPPPGQPRLLGADASHAWAAIWCPHAGWVGLDPTNDCLTATGHVTLAVGRDFGDVTPLRGVILGGASHQLEVAVSVVPAAA